MERLNENTIIRAYKSGIIININNNGNATNMAQYILIISDDNWYGVFLNVKYKRSNKTIHKKYNWIAYKSVNIVSNTIDLNDDDNDI